GGGGGGGRSPRGRPPRRDTCATALPGPGDSRTRGQKQPGRITEIQSPSPPVPLSPSPYAISAASCLSGNRSPTNTSYTQAPRTPPTHGATIGTHHHPFPAVKTSPPSPRWT